ncbi:unnamed protein product [Rotaria magnacalcarata]|uniref:DM10 domain-containing protein n=1 Tax=Rotaria magnacalcarata TaxID=392030 RepID=A0A816ZXP1_9BILA|nr:unnamed protein product [Rotaria magnacalcarata]CAF4019044.1 unnamed protein product [Rotaria magnacalcarata]
MNDLPLLPGNRFSDVTRTNFIVPRTLSFKNGHRIVRLPRLGIGQTYKPNVELTEDEREILNNFQPELIYGKVKVKEYRKFVPASVHYDKKVLRFYGYFKQTIYDSPLEYYRVRRVIVYYYLEDDTIAIYEIPYKNSALVQGMRVRRHRISKNDHNEPYNWRDLNLGQNLAIYGTVYRLCVCDQFTREWLESEGIELQCPELIPSDPYTLKLIEKNESEKQRMNHSDLKEILPDRLAKQPIISNRKILSMDGKVLRFYAIIDDHDQECDILRKFIIHFYLVDNTIEIREVHRDNDGYDPIGVYLHRQIVPKDSNYNIQSFVNLFINKHEQEKICYFTLEDFAIGRHVTIFNRIFFLYDCDTFTKSFYHQHFGQIDFTPIDIDTKNNNNKPPVQLPPVPPHIMFGKPEDTIQNVKSLLPKPVKKDRIKLMENENRVLRYEAMMDGDCQRKFLIVYRLADDLISVYEKPLDGYGCSTRKFLERIRIPKPDSHPDVPMYYGPNDFYIGAHIELFKHPFIIIDADRYVLKFIEENRLQFSQHVIDSLRQKLCPDNENNNQMETPQL